MAKKNKTLDYLDSLANHFAERDWDYTRFDHIESIRYDKEYDPHNRIGARIKRAASWLFSPTPSWLRQLEGKRQSLGQRLRMAIYVLKRDPNLPDGVLDGGNIITFWEETGEYLNLMQPTVGALLVTFLKEEPEHPHAILITKELERLHRRFNKRIKNGEVQ